MTAAQRRFGNTTLVQFEDFGNSNGLRMLNDYRGRAACFNDDIQGTAAAMLAGIIAALPLIGGTLASQTYLFAGAGETGCGMAEMLALAISKQLKARPPITFKSTPPIAPIGGCSDRGCDASLWRAGGRRR